MKSVYLKELLLLLISVLLTVMVAEFIVRYTHSAWPFQEKLVKLSHLTLQDKDLRWRFTPGGELNSLGLKNKEIRKKGEDIYRILFLGDSLIWSGDTSSGNLYTEVVENNLNKQLNLPGKRIEVINAGIPGYTTYQELEFLKIYGLDMEPDLVILGFVFNDLYYKYLHRPTEVKMLDQEPAVLLNRFDTSTFPGVLFSRSYLAHDVYYFLERLVNKMDRVTRGAKGHRWYPFENRTDFYLAWKEYGWRDTARLLGEMRRMLDEKDVEFSVIIFPVVTQVDEFYRGARDQYVLYPQRMIGSILDNFGIPYLDLTEILYTKGSPEVFLDFVHLNGMGNDIIADELTRYLIENKSTWLGVPQD